jgi:hypothetical protein
MRKQMSRAVIGTDNFPLELRTEGGRHRRKRGRPAPKVCQ